MQASCTFNSTTSQQTCSGRPKKRQRSKKPVDAPTRPKSAYMFFLGEFREQYKVTTGLHLHLIQLQQQLLSLLRLASGDSQLENPDSKKVAEVASAAGEKWRSLSEEEKKGYEERSDKAKVSHVRSSASFLTVQCRLSSTAYRKLAPFM